MSVLEFSWHMKIVLNQDALVPGFSMVLEEIEGPSEDDLKQIEEGDEA